MGKDTGPTFEALYNNLNNESKESIKLYAEFLLTLQRKREKEGKTKKDKGEFLAGLAHIPVPVDNMNIDRAEIYEDRF